MLAQGLGNLVRSFIGNPETEARNQVLASEALLNNQTAQYRDAIGDTGLSGDLAGMMIRSLQAGPQYARVAPGIGNAAIGFGARGFGREELTPTGEIASMILSAGRRSGGGRSGGPTRGGDVEVTQGALNRIARMVRDAGYEGADAAMVSSGIVDAYANGEFATLDQAAASVLPNVRREEVQVGEIPNEFFGENGTWNPLNMFRGPSPIMEERVVLPSAGNNETRVINEAREAISRGADPDAVRARLVEMGIDPGSL